MAETAPMQKSTQTATDVVAVCKSILYVEQQPIVSTNLTEKIPTILPALDDFIQNCDNVKRKNSLQRLQYSLNAIIDPQKVVKQLISILGDDEEGKPSFERGASLVLDDLFMDDILGEDYKYITSSDVKTTPTKTATDQQTIYFQLGTSVKLITVNSTADTNQEITLKVLEKFSNSVLPTESLYVRRSSTNDTFIPINEFKFKDIKKGDIIEIQKQPNAKQGALKDTATTSEVSSSNSNSSSSNSNSAVEIALSEISKEIRDLKKLIIEKTDLQQQQQQQQNSNSARRVSFDGKGAIVRPTSAQIHTLLNQQNTNGSNNLQQSKVIKSNLEQVKVLRRDVAILKQTIKNFQNDFNGVLEDLLGQVVAVRQESLSQPDDITKRKLLVSAKSQMQTQSTELLEKNTNLNDIIEELKQDVTVRKVRPTEQKLKLIDSELINLEKQGKEFANFVDQVRPTWKSVWEKELKTIVTEQTFLKECEGQSVDLDEDYTNMSSIFETLKKLLQLQTQQANSTSSSSSRTRGGADDDDDSSSSSKRRTTRRVVLDVLGPEEVQSNMSSILNEIRLSVNDKDSQKRMSALSKMTALREFDKAGEVNEFEQELSTFVKESKLRPTGGVDEVERKKANVVDLGI